MGKSPDELRPPGGHRLPSPAGRALAPPPRPLPPAVDTIDVSILVHLLRDARASLRHIGQAVGMSAPAVAERIGRLERTGVVRGYRAEVDWERLGLGLVVYVGVVADQGGEQPLAVRELRRIPEVEDVEVVTGPLDLLVRLRVRDHQHLRDCLFDRIWKIPGLHRTETFICLGRLPPKAFDLELAESLLASAPGRDGLGNGRGPVTAGPPRAGRPSPPPRSGGG
ncbi:MAG TPA: Lrp/AsnC family transcriptional regulator [Candidatus Micrarchaeia archaeon]|nr:Lrp/AsnC family transcriptional regulator [Candidatus Micrarchaeia archaeon]